MNKRQRKKKDKKRINSPDSTFAYLDREPSLSLEKLKSTIMGIFKIPDKQHKITIFSNPFTKDNFYHHYMMGSWDVSKEGDKTAVQVFGYDFAKVESKIMSQLVGSFDCPICEQEELMTLQELVNKINRYRRNMNQNLDDIWIHSRPSSSGGGTTMEIRCGVAMTGKLLAKSTNGGALNWFLKGMLTAFQNDAAPSISGFNQQLIAITRSNYSRIVDKED